MKQAISLAATIILLFPMSYFFVTSPTFLLVRLDIPEVTQLLRGHFHAYFLMIAIAGTVAAIGLALVGRPAFALGGGLMSAYAIWAHHWFLRQMDVQLSARDAGNADAVHRLRQLHWGGMLSNALQLAVVVVSIPYLSSP